MGLVKAQLIEVEDQEMAEALSELMTGQTPSSDNPIWAAIIEQDRMNELLDNEIKAAKKRLRKLDSEMVRLLSERALLNAERGELRILYRKLKRIKRNQV